MTQPEPSAAPADTSPEPPEAGSGQQQETPAFDPSSLPPEAQAYLKSQIETAGFKARETARRTAAEKAAADARAETMAEIAQKLGLAGSGQEEPMSPEEFESALEAASSTAFRANIEGQMYRLASRHGYDVEAMLDSKAFENDFIDALDETEGITDLDPRSSEFKAAVEAAMQAAVEKHPRFAPRSGPRPDPSQGARGNGPADLDGRIAEAQQRGDWKTVISLQNQKLAKL